MAWLEQKKSGQFLAAFRFGEERFKRSLRTSRPKEARAARSRIEENIRLVERGVLTLPEDADVVAFLLSDGRFPARVVVKKPTTLPSLITQYREKIRRDSIEENSWTTIKLHLRHVERVLGKRLALHEVILTKLQEYVDHRAVEPDIRRCQTNSRAGDDILREERFADSPFRSTVHARAVYKSAAACRESRLGMWASCRSLFVIEVGRGKKRERN